jgi:hypothetical protein
MPTVGERLRANDINGEEILEMIHSDFLAMDIAEADVARLLHHITPFRAAAATAAATAASDDHDEGTLHSFTYMHLTSTNHSISYRSYHANHNFRNQKGFQILTSL